MILMLRRFGKAGILHVSSDEDGCDRLYYVPNGTCAVLVKAPDENAVHAFQQPEGCNVSQFRARVFALFRQFSFAITQQLTRVGEEPRYARIGDDPDNLPEVWVMRESDPDSKLRRNLDVLTSYPEMLGELAPENGNDPRPSLKEYVGWTNKYTHQNKQLTKKVFNESLGVAEKVVKKLERRTIREIRRARKTIGDVKKREFAGGSWVHEKKKKRKQAGGTARAR
eukprot:TRINITY_DN48595_c0_g1_i1.p2 TRINITY_DN48595_c0_g1~~TRINITY_DN48595_c0_g1_i1.p2  ORF type:complete len:225 (+),score=35.05 TRINITY_DN48595_c0_g1_i1:966-1640(+)